MQCDKSKNTIWAPGLISTGLRYVSNLRKVDSKLAGQVLLSNMRRDASAQACCMQEAGRQKSPSCTKLRVAHFVSQLQWVKASERWILKQPKRSTPVTPVTRDTCDTCNAHCQAGRHTWRKPSCHVALLWNTSYHVGKTITTFYHDWKQGFHASHHARGKLPQ